MSNTNNNSIFQQEMLSIKDKILAIVNDRTHKYDNYHYSSFRDNIIYLLNRYPDNPEKQYVSVMLATLLIHSMKSEFYTRNVYTHGDIHFEDNSLYTIYEAEYDHFISVLEKYICQSAENSVFFEESWSLYFLTEFIVTELFYHQGYAISQSADARSEWFPEAQNQSTESILESFYKHFYGLFPIIDNNSTEINSNIPLKYSSQFCFGFLYYPEKFINTFVDKIPGYLHEICHYVPPISRKRRNTVAIRLLVHTLINRWQNALYDKLTEHSFERQQIEKICSFYYDFMLKYLNQRVESMPTNNSAIEIDSMNIYLLLTDCLKHISCESMLEEMYNIKIDLTSFNNIEAEIILSVIFELQHNPVLNNFLHEPWVTSAEKFISTYNVLLRELRSDIYMTRMLNISLEKYIELMAKEVRFGYNDVSIVGDAAIFRFGLITHFLWQTKSNKQFDEFASFDEYQDWKNRCISILEKINDVPPHITDNLKKYLDKYCDMAIEQEDNHYVKQYHSTLEKELCDQIIEWNNQATGMHDFPSVRYLRRLHTIDYSPQQIYKDIYQTSVNGLQQWKQTWPFAPFTDD